MVRILMRWVLVLLLMSGARYAAAASPEIPFVSDLRQEAALVQKQQTPLLLMFYADHCVYCERMEKEFLKPMLISGAYDDKVLIRRVRLDDTPLRDFNGRKITGAELGSRYKVFVTPTLVFLDSKGHMLADKMVGLGTPDYFGGYLDAAIDTSLSRLHGRSAVATKRPENCSPVC